MNTPHGGPETGPTDDMPHGPDGDAGGAGGHPGGRDVDQPTTAVPPVDQPTTAVPPVDQPTAAVPPVGAPPPQDPPPQGWHGAQAGPPPGPPADEERTQTIPVTGGSGSEARSSRRRPLLIGAAVAGLLLVLYVGDLVVSSTAVPRGVAVAGVDIGGMSKPDAEATLRSELGPRLAEPVELRAGEATATLDPSQAGLEFDPSATIAQAGEQPLNPFSRVASVFRTQELPPATSINRFTVTQALEGMRPQLDRPVQEGGIRFEGAQPVGVPPQAGQRIDAETGTDEVAAHWLDPTPVELPADVTPTTVTPEGIQTALEDVAVPATAGPLWVVGDRMNATVSPEDIGRLMTFVPDDSGGLTPGIDQEVATSIVQPQLASTEVEGRDASYDFVGETATVRPSVVGREIDWTATFSGLLPALAEPAGQPEPPVFAPPPPPPGVAPPAPPPATGRAVNAVYTTTQPEVTTEELEAVGPAVMIGEFETSGFADDSGQNIRRAAEQVNGAVVAPDEVFSLNGFTGPRSAAAGYVDAGIIEDGVPARGIGGGVSQFATTLYNAAYFAGMEDVEHQEHSYYISRYPAGREATVFEGAIDLKFRNTNPTPVLIRTTWTPSSIRIQLYGQKRWEVTSETGERTNPVPHDTRDLGANPNCSPSAGIDGFTITDTRVLRDVETGEVRREPRTVRYEPAPEVTCEGGPAEGPTPPN